MIEEKFSPGFSFLHQADPKMKILGFIFPALVIAVSASFTTLSLGLLLGLILLILARLEFTHVCKQLLGINIFILFFWIILPFNGGGDILTHLGPLPIYKKGVELSSLLTLKANSITLLIISLLATSSVIKIGQGLNQLGFSSKFTLLLVSSFRYLDVIHQEYLRLRRAADLRCFQPGNNAHTYRTFSYLIGMTLVRSYQRADRIHNAMIMRGFKGTFPSLDTAAAKTSDYILAALLICLSLLLAVINWY